MRTNLQWTIYMSILLMLGSCNSTGSKQPTITDDSPAQDIMVNQVKAYQDTVFFYMSKAIDNMSGDGTQAEKQAVKDEMNNLARPYQTKLDSLKSLLPADRAQEIDDYRQELFDSVTNKKRE